MFYFAIKTLFFKDNFFNSLQDDSDVETQKEASSLNIDNSINDVAGSMLPGGKASDLTEEQLQEQLTLQKEQFEHELEKQRVQMQLDYQALKLQLAQQTKQLEDFQRQLELVRTMLPKDYQIIKNNPDLQVRSRCQIWRQVQSV